MSKGPDPEDAAQAAPGALEQELRAQARRWSRRVRWAGWAVALASMALGARMFAMRYGG